MAEGMKPFNQAQAEARYKTGFGKGPFFANPVKGSPELDFVDAQQPEVKQSLGDLVSVTGMGKTTDPHK